MAYTYTTFRLAVQTMVVSQDPDSDFDNILPSAIDYANERIYRELNLISSTVTDTTTTTTSGQRNLSIPDNFVVVYNVSVLSPAGSTPTTGARVPLVPVSRDLVDNVWPGNAVTGAPAMFAMVDQWSMVLGPAPNGAYTVEVVGTQRPAPLSADVPTTFLSERLPDLLMAATMIFMSGYLRNFGQQANDPQMGASWESQYQALKAGADVEELRKFFAASSWSSYPLSSQAQPQRG